MAERACSGAILYSRRHDGRGLSRIGLDELHALAARGNDALDHIRILLEVVGADDAHRLGDPGRDVGGGPGRAIVGLLLAPHRLEHIRDVDAALTQGGEPGADAADGLAVERIAEPAGLDHHRAQDVGDRLGTGIAELPALEVGKLPDIGVFLAGDPQLVGYRQHTAVDDGQLHALLDGGDRRRQRDLAIGNVGSEGIADRRAAARRGDEAGDVEAGFALEPALVARDGERHAVHAGAEMRDGEIDCRGAARAEQGGSECSRAGSPAKLSGLEHVGLR